MFEAAIAVWVLTTVFERTPNKVGDGVSGTGTKIGRGSGLDEEGIYRTIRAKSETEFRRGKNVIGDRNPSPYSLPFCFIPFYLN